MTGGSGGRRKRLAAIGKKLNKDAQSAAPRIGSGAALHLRVRPVFALDDSQFGALCQLNPDLRIERTPEGGITAVASARGEAGRRNAQVFERLSFWTQNTGHGVSLDSSTGVALPNGAIRSPDASWIASARWNALSPAKRGGVVPLCPNLVVQLRSDSDGLANLQQKMAEFMAAGAELGWLIDPVEAQAFVYRPGFDAERLANPRWLCGDPLLPGFRLNLRDVLGLS